MTSPNEDSGLHVDALLALMAQKGASDLHITTPSCPTLRIDDQLIPQTNLPAVTPQRARVLFEQITTPEQRAAFEHDLELDFAYSVPGLARFRVNAMWQRGTISLAFRLVPFTLPTIDDLGLPQVLKTLITKPRGLILITGAAGNGKSTTLAAMINHLNQTAHRNIITIEDPIEYLFHNNTCIIRQRELGCDTSSFESALVHALRHDPDIIVIGEMRDLATISNAITAAETGHLVIGTMHTVDAAQSIDRIIDAFPSSQQHQVRSQLAQVLEAVLSQFLLNRTGGGRVVAMEILLTSPVIRQFIRENKLSEITGHLEMGQSEGRQSMNQAMADLVQRQIITREDALRMSSDPGRLDELLNPGARYRIGV